MTIRTKSSTTIMSSSHRLLLRPPPFPTTAASHFRSSTFPFSTHYHGRLLSKPQPSSSTLATTTTYFTELGLSKKNSRNMVKCMANPRRVKMVAKQIQRELSDMLLTDKVLQYAVLPEASLGADRYLSSLTTISDVEVSGDLQVVKVYVSVFGDERGREIAIAGLKSKAKYVRSELGRRMKLRLTPEIRFIEDESLERGSRVIAILDRLKGEKKNLQDGGQLQQDTSDAPPEDEDWDDDNPEEGVIYVK